MTPRTIHGIILVGLLVAPTLALAKLPPPPDATPEQKAKAAEAAAKTAWSAKVEGFRLCKAMERAAVNHLEVAKARGASVTPDPAAPACVDPGAFVYNPPQATPAVDAPKK